MSQHLQDLQGPVRDPSAVREMFDSIAPRYDLTNRVMSFGRDQSWRKRAAALTETGSEHIVLDCACGTGRLAEALLKQGTGHVVGLDFSPEMLQLAAKRVHGARYVLSDISALPFPDKHFDAATIGFGLRNLADPNRGLREMARVLRPGGRLVVLEAVRPSGVFAPVLDRSLKLWVGATLPRLGRRLSTHSYAYRYLSETVRTYATAEDVAEWFRQVGLNGVQIKRRMFGTVALVVGKKPLEERSIA